MVRNRNHGYEDITLGADDCTAHGRATVARTEAMLLILCGISGGRVLAQDAFESEDYAEAEGAGLLGEGAVACVSVRAGPSPGRSLRVRPCQDPEAIKNVVAHLARTKR